MALIDNPLNGSGQFTLTGLLLALVVYIRNAPMEKWKAELNKKYDPAGGKSVGRWRTWYKHRRRVASHIWRHAYLQLFIVFLILIVATRVFVAILWSYPRPIGDQPDRVQLAAFWDGCLGLSLVVAAIIFLCEHLYTDGRDIWLACDAHADAVKWLRKLEDLPDIPQTKPKRLKGTTEEPVVDPSDGDRAPADGSEHE